MHIEKIICDNVLGTLMSIEGKSKDTTNVRKDLRNMGTRQELNLRTDGNSVHVLLDGIHYHNLNGKCFING